MTGSDADARTKGRPWRLWMDSAEMTRTGVAVGSSVAVRTRYLGSWTTGFEIAELLDDGYRVRRVSDGTVLPEVFAFHDIQRLFDGP